MQGSSGWTHLRTGSTDQRVQQGARLMPYESWAGEPFTWWDRAQTRRTHLLVGFAPDGDSVDGYTNHTLHATLQQRMKQVPT